MGLEMVIIWWQMVADCCPCKTLLPNRASKPADERDSASWKPLHHELRMRRALESGFFPVLQFQWLGRIPVKDVHKIHL